MMSLTRPDIARMKAPTYDADVNDIDALLAYIGELEAKNESTMDWAISRITTMEAELAAAEGCVERLRGALEVIAADDEPEGALYRLAAEEALAELEGGNERLLPSH